MFLAAAPWGIASADAATGIAHASANAIKRHALCNIFRPKESICFTFRLGQQFVDPTLGFETPADSVSWKFPLPGTPRSAQATRRQATCSRRV
jgi:hypothetical protein